MGPFLFFLIVGGIVTAIIVFSIKSAEETKRKWDLAARELKLRYLKGSMFNPGVIAGKFNKHVVKVDTFSRSSGKNSQTYTRFRMDYKRPIKFHFHITKQNFMHNFGKAFGMQDVEVGDPSFDDKVIIKSNNPKELKKFLTPAKKDLIGTIMGLFHEVNITNTHVEIIIRGTVRNSRLIKSNIKRLSRIADGFSKLTRTGDSAKKDAKTPELVEVIEPVVKAPAVMKEKSLQREAFTPKPEVVEIEVPEQKIEALEAVTILPDILEEEIGEQPQKESEKSIEKTEVSKSEDKLSKEVETKIPETSLSTESSGSLSHEEFCNEVFESGISTFESSKIFEKKFKDAEITWEGSLVSAAEFSFDFVFKNSSGVKATFDIMEIESGYSKTKINAVVHFPKDQLEKLKASMNKKIKFSGKLVSVDGLVKNIFVGEGKLN